MHAFVVSLSLLGLISYLFKELLQVGLLVFEELDLGVSLLELDLFSLLVALLNGLDLRSQLRDLVLKLSLLVLQLLNSLLKISLSMLCLQLLSHSKGDGGLVESLVGADSHLDLVTYPHQQEAPLRAVDCYLPNYFIEPL